MQGNGNQHYSKYFRLCSAEERKSYTYETTMGRESDDRFFITGWTITLKKQLNSIKRVDYIS